MTSLSNLINQFITEHDAGIIKIKELATLLEKELALCERETSTLKAENETLKAEKSNLEKENAELKEKLKTFEQPSYDNVQYEQTISLSTLANAEESITEIDISQISQDILRKKGAI